MGHSSDIASGFGGTPRPTAEPFVTAVVPMHDEEENAPAFLPALRDALLALTPRFEIVVVNDGSHDRTRDAVLAAGASCRVRYLELSRNFGKEAALSAGIAAARGDVVLCIDADFQHPLATIPLMLERWREGYDMVFGLRSSRRGETWMKRTGTALFYGIIARGAQVPIPPGAGDFRLFDRKVAAALRQLPERSRFMKGLYAWVGFRSVAVEYDVAPRASGRSSYGLSALTRLAFAGITAFTKIPLRVISAFGVLVSLCALGYGAYVVFATLTQGEAPPGYPTVVVSIMFFSGVQLLSIGVLGEYLGRVFDEVKRRPVYVIADTVDFTSADPQAPRPPAPPA